MKKNAGDKSSEEKCCEKCSDLFFEKDYPAHTAIPCCSNRKCECHSSPDTVEESWEKRFDKLTPDEYEVNTDYDAQKKWLQENPHLYTGTMYDEPAFTLDKEKIKEVLGL